jgi:hypothetical protein
MQNGLAKGRTEGDVTVMWCRSDLQKSEGRGYLKRSEVRIGVAKEDKGVLSAVRCGLGRACNVVR